MVHFSAGRRITGCIAAHGLRTDTQTQLTWLRLPVQLQPSLDCRLSDTAHMAMKHQVL